MWGLGGVAVRWLHGLDEVFPGDLWEFAGYYLVYLLRRKQLEQLPLHHSRQPSAELVDEVVEQINHGYRNWITGLGTHDLASLYKRWIRAIPGGLIDARGSERIYDGTEPFDIVAHMAPLHRNVLLHLVGFLKDFATAEPITKMGISNLALVFGASVSVGHPKSDPTIIQEFPRQAKAFVEKLLNEADVSSMYPLTFW
jgi:hypothetical protein